MKKIEFIKDNIHQFVTERKLVCKVHRFTRMEIFGEVTDRYESTINMAMTGSACPVQYEGTINGKNAYYRDRHGVWYLEIYDGEIMESNVIFRKEGVSSEDIGYSGMLAAEKRIMKCSIKFSKKTSEKKKE